MGNRAKEGAPYGNLGLAYERLGDFKKAIHYHDLRLEIATQLGERVGEGYACGSLGDCHAKLGDFKKASHYHGLHLKISKEAGNRSEEGRGYSSLGGDYQRRGDLKKAIHFHELHLAFTKEEGKRDEEGCAYGNLGNAYSSLGSFRKAIHYHELHLEIAKQIGDRAGQGIAYCNLGSDYQSLGDSKKALYYCELHLDIVKQLGDRDGEGVAYCNLGNHYLRLEDFKNAIYYHELYLNFSEEVCNRDGKKRAYGNLGTDYQSLGDFKKAIYYHELKLEFSKEVGDRAGEGSACGSLGNDYQDLRDFKEAIHYHDLCLNITKEVGDRQGEGVSYGDLGNDYYGLGNFEKAFYYHERDLEISKEVGDRAGEGSAYGILGNDYFKIGIFDKAIHYHKLSLKLSEEVGNTAFEGIAYGNLGLDHESLGDFKMAITCYRSSMRVLNDVRARLQLKDEWKITFRHKYQLAYTRLWCLLLNQGKVVEALVAAEEGRAQALKDLVKFKYGFGTSHDDVHTLEKPIIDIFSCVRSNTVFAALEKREVFLWVIHEGKDIKLRRNEVRDNQLGDASSFFHSLVETVFESVKPDVQCEDRSLGKLRAPLMADQMQPHSLHLQPNALKTLYQALIGPVEDLIHGNELVIVPEGPLWLTPYAAFMDSNSKYLSESFRIRVIPSLENLKLIGDCPIDYHRKTGTLLVGDPWVQDVVNYDLCQLPCAKEEVEMIGEILNTAPLTGTDATKDEVLKRLSSVALVHIAAHGRMETGEIALAPSTTRTSDEPEDDDFLLTMADVLEVKLQTRLVVLSCCHSGRGEIKAEGVVGIARAFLGAGARSVMVSLWAIDDQATLEFMKIFYQHLKEGRSASEALNRAMKCMRESDKFSEVKCWAPFVLIGDDVTLEFSGDD